MELSRIDALEQARAELQRKLQRLAAVYEMTIVIGSLREVDHIIAFILGSLSKLVPHDEACLYLVEDGEGKLARLQASSGEVDFLRQREHFNLGEGFIGSIVATGAPAVLSRVTKDLNPAPPQYPKPWGTVVIAPLRAGGRVLGALTLARLGTDSISEDESHLTMLVASQAASAIGDARLLEQLQHRMTLHQQLFSKLISAQEDERKRIAVELHDDTLQVLGVNLLKVDMCESLLQRGEHEQALQELQGLRSTLQYSIKTLREILFNLRPSTLDMQGLLPTMDVLLQHFEAETGVRTRFTSSLGKRLEPHLEVLIYRLTQEALSNVRKHANAQNVSIDLKSRRGVVRLTIEDDGQGFSIRDSLERNLSLGHIGLHSMRERAELAGGSMNIESELGRGTRLTIAMPLSLTPNP